MVATIGLSQVLLALTALPFIRPHNLYKPVPVPFDISFTLGTTIFTPAEVLTLIVAPIVALALAVAVRSTSWGLTMRAMSENADSARLSGVWIRRTSTLTWTVAGALSAFTAILNAPGQTSALTEVLSPDLLLFALTAALVGAMINLTVAFVAGIGVGVLYELLQWNIASTANQQLVLFIVLLAVLVDPGARLAQGQPLGRALHLAARRHHRAGHRRRVAPPGLGVGHAWLATLGAVVLPFVLNVGNNYLFSQVCIYAVIALSLTVLTGWAGQVSLGQFGLVAVGALVAAHLGASFPLPLLLLFAGAVTAVVAVIVGLPALRMPGLFLAVTTLGFAIFMQEAVLATPCWTVPGIDKTVCTGSAQPGLHPDRPADVVRPQPPVTAIVRLVLAGRPRPVDPRRAGLARQGGGPAAGRRAGQRARRGGHGDPRAAHQAAGLRALGLHGRLRRRLPRLRDPALQHGDLRPDDLVHHHLHGGDRRPGLHPGSRPRRALSRGPARPLRRQRRPSSS